jgi:D-sedoheptulose 7-phosphate isomerase
MVEQIKNSIKESIRQKETLLKSIEGVAFIESFSETVINALQHGKKLLICGNGGSAADAQHFAAELVGRFMIDRKPLPAIALTTDTSVITAVGNDYSFDDIFSRQVEALAVEGDVVVGISTSGNSENVIKAICAAQEKGCHTFGLLGKNGGKLKTLCKQSYVVPSDESARIQEVHIMIEHIICQMVEEKIFGL